MDLIYKLLKLWCLAAGAAGAFMCGVIGYDFVKREWDLLGDTVFDA